jgi:DNA-binding transcriptional LysR family regulator
MVNTARAARPPASTSQRRPPSLRELEVLQAMIATRKTVAAAQRLGISQPAVSRALAALEAHVGRPLFAREGGRLVPTADAFALDAEAQPIFAALDRLNHWPGQAVQASVLRIATPPTLAQFVLPPVLAEFRRQEPDVVANVEIDTSSTVITQVADRAVDVGLVDMSASHIGIQGKVIREAVAHVLMPEEHPLADREVLTPQDLAEEPIIALARRFPERIKVEQAFATPVSPCAWSGRHRCCFRRRNGQAARRPRPAEPVSADARRAAGAGGSALRASHHLSHDAAVSVRRTCRAGGAPFRRSADRDAAGGRPDHADQVASERLEGDDRVGVGDLRDRLHLLGDEMADVDIGRDMELGQDVVIAGGRVDFRGDLAVGEFAGDLIGLAEPAFDLDEEGLHRALRNPVASG